MARMNKNDEDSKKIPETDPRSNSTGISKNGHTKAEIKTETFDIVDPNPMAEAESQNRFIRLIVQHYRVTAPKRSDAQLESEKWLLPPYVKFNRWYSMPAAIVPHFCCGSVYAWSVFNKPIDAYINENADGGNAFSSNHTSNSSSAASGSAATASLTPVTFYIALGFLGISAAIMGPWLERNGPRKACLLGTCLFFAGQLLTALALFLRQLWLVFLGYGVIGGVGLGLCYISPVSALQKWFMDKRGLASGVAVCGFGAGSIALAKIQSWLIQNVGLPYTFIVLGCVYFLCMIPAALTLRTPPPGYIVGQNSDTKNSDNGIVPRGWTLIEAITSRTYRLMYVMFFANIIFGLVVISRLSNMVTDLFSRSASEAATIVAINGGFNLAGRLVFSTLSDYVGRKNCYVLMLSTQLAILGTFSTITTTGTYWAFLLSMWTLAFCYGAGFGTIPAFLTDVFGSANIGACHGIILTAWSSASIIGGAVFTAVFDRIVHDGTGEAPGQVRDKGDPFPYNVNVWWMFGVVFIGWVAILFVEPTRQDRAFTNGIRKCFCHSCIAPLEGTL